MKKANFTTISFSIVSRAVLGLLMVCSVFALQAQTGLSATCGGGPYFDTGGASKPYDDTVVQTYYVCPQNNMTEYVKVVFNQYDLANGDVLQVYDGDLRDYPNAPLIATTGGGSSVADAPGGGWIISDPCGIDTDGDGDIDSDNHNNNGGLSNDDLSGCLTLVFTPNGDQTKGAGYAFHVECEDRGFFFPLEGNNQIFTEVISLGEFCEGTGINFNNFPIPQYSDCTGGDLIVTSDCPDVIITATTITVPVGTATITFTSPLFPEKQASYTYIVLPPSLGCNDEVNVSLLNNCTIAVTPDLILEDPCEFADNLSGTAAYTVDYTVEFSDPNILIVGTTLQGFPVADFSSVPCGTRVDVKVSRVIESLCSEDFVDICWGQIVIEDKVAPILQQNIEDYTLDCYDVPDDFLDILNDRARGTNSIFVDDVVDLFQNGVGPVTAVAGIGEGNFPGFDNCKFSYGVGTWEEVRFDCQTDVLDSHSQDFFDDPLWELMMVEFGPEARFRCYFRTVQLSDKCGNDSDFGIQRICVVQPDIVHPRLEISLPCFEDPDPVALYNKYLSDPVRFQEYACYIPAYDRTPADLNGNFDHFAGLDDTYLTDCSGDEVPADPTDHAECGYAIDWDDSNRIDVCAETYKIFREWTVYNWCDGHLEIIDVVPQVVKVGDTREPTFRLTAFGVVGGAYYNCVADVELSFVFEDDCSSNTKVSYQIFDFSGNVPLLPGFNQAEFDATNGTIVIPEFPIEQTVFVRLRFIDDCGNSSDFNTFAFSIEDEVPPVAICESFHAVSLGIGCEVIVPAEVFDDGSYDNCGTVTFSVARMDDVGDFLNDNDGDGLVDDLDSDGDAFKPTITFTEEDLDDCTGNVMVVFRVQDSGLDLNGDHDFNDPGEKRPNSNFCMVEVELQDKLPPALVTGKLTYDCDEPFAEVLLAAAADDDGEDSFAQLISDAFANQITDLFGSDNCGIASFEVSSFDNRIDFTCREGSIFVDYQATDDCGNVSRIATLEFCLVQRSDWKMNFPMDAQVFCEDTDDSSTGLPAAADIHDILDNNGCDHWGLEVNEEQFDGTEGACFKLIREYHLINWCTWNPNNTEKAVVERPQELILDPFYTVALRYADLIVNGTNGQGANARPDGLNDIDDGDEDNDGDYLYFVDPYTYAPIRIPFTGAQIRNIADDDEAEVCDPYDVTDQTIDGDWVIIDFNDLPAAVNGQIVTTTARSQFSNVTERYVSAQEYGNIIYRQIIKVTDISSPDIDVTQNGPFCGGYDDPGEDGLCAGDVNVKFSASDLCSDKLSVTYRLEAFVDENNNNPALVLSESADTFGELNADGNDYSITGSYPIGRHVFVVTVFDNCSNSEEVEIPFEVNDCKAPTAKCLFGLAVDLMGPNSNGSPGMITIGAEWFDKDSYDFCSDVTLTFADPNIYPDSTERTFRCADGEIGVVAVELWVQDEAGNTAFCETFVNVQANPQNGGEEDICPTAADGAASVAGAILTEESEAVENVEVTLTGDADVTYMTGGDGSYNFSNLEAGYDYSVSPQLDAEPLNGVSTFDLVLMSKHILGVEVLDSPYKMIAADVNNSGSITTFDIVQLRKVLLGIDTNFPGNTSWRFIATDLSNVTNPFDVDFEEVMNINDLEGAYTNANFTAVKIGDVNGTVTTNANSIEERSLNGAFTLTTADANLMAGQEYEVAFTADLASMMGYQFTMNLEGLEVVKVLEGEASEANFGLFGNVLTASWNNEAATDLAFTLLVRATKDVTLSESMNITSDVTPAEAYTTTGEAQTVALNFAKAGYALGQNNPNPFKGETLIQVTMPDAQRASLRVHDVTGKVLKEIVQDFDQGVTTIKMSSKDLQAGVLYYTLQAEDFMITKKMIVLE